MKKSEIRIGLLAPLTGIVHMYGEEISRAALIAVEEINENGGILGRKLRLIVEDDGSLPQSAVPAGNRLIEFHKCSAIIGNLLSNSRISVANNVSLPKKTPYLNFSFYEGSIYNPFFFNFAALPNQQIDKMIPYMVKKFGYKIFFAGSNYEWPRGSIDAGKKILHEIGGEVVGEEYLPIGSKNINHLLKKVESSGADIFVPYFAGSDQIYLLTRFTEMGLKNKMVVVTGHLDEVMASQMEPFVREGLYSGNTYFMGMDTKENRRYLDRLARMDNVTGIWPEGNGMLTNFGEATYVCVHAFARAAIEAGELEQIPFLRAMENISLKSLQGSVVMDKRTHHAAVNSFLARCGSDGSFYIVEKFGLIPPNIPSRYNHSLSEWKTNLMETTAERRDPVVQRPDKPEMTPVLMVTRDTTIIFSNKVFANLLFENRENVCGEKLSDIFPEFKNIGDLQLLFDKNTNYREEVIIFDQCTFSLAIERIPEKMIEENECYLLIIIPVSGSLKGKLVTDTFLNPGISPSKVAVIFCDEKQIIWFANRGACFSFGYGENELVGNNLKILVPVYHREDHARYVQMYLESARVEQKMSRIGQISGYTKEGSEFPAIAAIATVKGQKKTFFVAIMDEYSEQKKAEEEELWRTDHDDLTQLPNKRLLLERMDHAIGRVGRLNNFFSILFIGLENACDAFSSLGHGIEEKLIQKIAMILLQNIRPGDFVARLGENQFAVLCEKFSFMEEINDLAQRITGFLKQPFYIQGATCLVNSNIGIAIGYSKSDSAITLLKNAENAMFEARKRGENCWHVFLDEAGE